MGFDYRSTCWLVGAGLGLACTPAPSGGGSGTTSNAGDSSSGDQGDSTPAAQSEDTRGPDGVDDSGTTTGGPVAGTGTTAGSDSGDSSDSGSGSGSEESTGEPLDCDNLADLPIDFNTVDGASSSEDFVFDGDGYLRNIVNGDLLRAEHGEASTLLFPGVGEWASGTAMLSNGDVVYADSGNNAVVRIDTMGGTEVLASGISYPNGLTVDMDDIVYVSEHSSDRILRIDPETLSVETATTGLQSPNGIAFDFDYEYLYIGSFGGGTVHRLHIESGTLELYGEDIGEWGLDGLIVDACGNVYVTDYGPGIVYKVDPDGQHEVVVDLPALWIPNLHFGSGVGGWSRDLLYVMSFDSDQVFALDLGIPGIPLPHL